MRGVAPSTIVREEIDQVFSRGVAPETNILSALAELGVRYVVQQGLEKEQADFLGRGRYERGAGSKGRRNGYEDGILRTGEGGIGVRVPQVRDSETPYQSKLMEFLSGNSEMLDRLVVEMYARGLSTRDIEDCFRGPDGELLLSRGAHPMLAAMEPRLYLRHRTTSAVPAARRAWNRSAAHARSREARSQAEGRMIARCLVSNQSRSRLSVDLRALISGGELANASKSQAAAFTRRTRP